jgi:adenylate kinase
MNKNFIVIIGPACSGKGTQAKNFAKYCGFAHLSTGEVFRDIIKNRTDDLALEVKGYINAGILVPDELTIKVFQERLQTMDKSLLSVGCVVDGFPRNNPQLETLSPFINEHFLDAEITYLYVTADREELIKRMLKRAQEDGRADDTPEIIETRLQIYEAETQPMLDVIKNSGLLHSIDSTGKNPEQVWEEIKTILKHVFEETI